ncbi:MAG: chemotaxis protein CheW [Xenococcaceae cyanobacterium]
MIQEYFGIQLSHSVRVALPLTDVETFAHIQRQRISPIPGVAKFWLGVANQRGSLLWVLDADQFFDLVPASDHQEQQLTAVVLTRLIQGTQRRVAWIVKELEGVLPVHSTQSQPLPPPLQPRFQTLFTATFKQDDKTIVVLDSEAFFQALRPQSNALIGI